MYYILFAKNTKRVVKVSKEPLKEQPTYYGQAEFYGELPSKYDYLTVSNLQEKTDTWTEKEQVEKENEQGEIVVEEIEVPKSRTYFVCDLVANFRPAPTQQEIEKRQAKIRIQELKKLLEETDYQAIKYAEGWLTAEEYAPIKTKRQAYREEINQLEMFL